MKFNKQLNLHDPANGVWGDCARTCLSCLLDLEPDDVPHFYDQGVNDAGHLAMREFLAERGIRLVQIAWPGTLPLEDVQQTMLNTNPGLLYLLIGKSGKFDCNHVVVCKDGEIIHDPSQVDSGVVGPCVRTGMWWIEILAVDL